MELTLTEVIRASLGESLEAFYTLPRLSELTGLSSQFWRARIDSGELVALQRKAKGSGSRLLVPRESLVQYLSEQAR